MKFNIDFDSLDISQAVAQLTEGTAKGDYRWELSIKGTKEIFSAIVGNGKHISIHVVGNGTKGYYLNRGVQEVIRPKAGEKLVRTIVASDKTHFSRIRAEAAKRQDDELKRQKELLVSNKSVDIQFRDFLLRRNVFRCMANNHKLKNVDAIVPVCKRNGIITLVSVPAGYCATCDRYYILTAAYDKLKMTGVPMCRVADEYSYGRYSVNSDMWLRDRSILMEYGYSVTKEQDLSEMARHKILANLMDYEVLTRNEIISYLDFFISMHTASIYEVAVSKWEEDRKFVLDYKVGRYKQYGAGGILR